MSDRYVKYVGYQGLGSGRGLGQPLPMPPGGVQSFQPVIVGERGMPTHHLRVQCEGVGGSYSEQCRTHPRLSMGPGMPPIIPGMPGGAASEFQPYRPICVAYCHLPDGRVSSITPATNRWDPPLTGFSGFGDVFYTSADAISYVKIVAGNVATFESAVKSAVGAKTLDLTSDLGKRVLAFIAYANNTIALALVEAATGLGGTPYRLIDSVNNRLKSIVSEFDAKTGKKVGATLTDTGQFEVSWSTWDWLLLGGIVVAGAWVYKTLFKGSLAPSQTPRYAGGRRR